MFLFKLEILVHKYFSQIDDFIMCLWHLNMNMYTLQKIQKGTKSESP
jgi:hypothetical protein